MDLFPDSRAHLLLDPGAVLLGGFALGEAGALVRAIDAIAAAAPFRRMETPGGRTMSVAMTNAGDAGWTTSRRGYRYSPVDPVTGHAWPAMPDVFLALATRAAAAAGFAGFLPDACLVNRYEAGARMALHQDRDEAGVDDPAETNPRNAAPIVSVSLGLPARFLWGGAARTDRARRVPLLHGDVVVWGGPARLTFHGIDTLAAGEHPETGAVRYNLTFRRALG
ncbi:DNA oxidative demethylase AlkB [Sphingomonas solaris]|uniref:DNA oxidative demethylase AlkB n=1 Tax=Alterirhizorhabdus solaris TaxID=2529389 RepID=A0A558QS08_9SPHN|nr:DNA oxidative demethylase AlkB [Sphingomonas solaris]TVV69852.1 DNA oxidative demethylase AlkB [Sphingomonas solaris]